MGCVFQPSFRTVVFGIAFVVAVIMSASCISPLDGDVDAVHTVTYDLDGGSGSIPGQQMEPGQMFYLPTYTGTKQGYEFCGWTDGDSRYMPNVSYTMPDKDVVFKAVWTPISYYVIFDPNGGTGEPATVKARYDIEMPNYSSYFSLKGYNMVSWNTARDGTGASFPAVGNLKNITSGDGEYVTLYAQWQPKQYVVTYLLDDTPGAESYKDHVVFDQTYKMRGETFFKEGSVQDGWADRVGGEAVYPLEFEFAKWDIDSDLTLYPSWFANTYTVTFDPNGGSGDMEPIAVPFGTEVVLPESTFELPGHVFDTWNTAADGSGVTYHAGDTYKVEDNVTLYVQWINYFTVTYDLNGGSGDFPQQGVKSKLDSVTITLSKDIPQYEGHRFIAWGSTAVSPERTYNPGDSITLTMAAPAITIYAQWQDMFYMGFDPMGGYGGPSAQVGYSDTTYTFTIPDVLPVKAGHTFDGWATSPGSAASYQPGSKVTLDRQHAVVMLYAVWSLETTYSLSYSANGGSGAPDIQYLKSAADKVVITIPNSKPSRSGYDFAGWSLSPGGTASYQPGDSIEVRGTAPACILYAVWSGTRVVADGVEIVFAPEFVSVGSTVKLKAAIHPDDATQRIPVWTSSDESVATVSSDGTVTGISAGTVTITARADSAVATVKIKVTEPLDVEVAVHDGVAEIENVPEILHEIENAKAAGIPVSLVVTTDTDKVAVDPQIIESLKTFENSQTVISSGDGQLIIPSAALSGLPKAESSMVFQTKLVDSPAEYSDQGDWCAELKVLVDGKEQSIKFNERIIVKIDYQLEEGDDPDTLEVLYIDDQGGTEAMKGSFYDDGKVWFTTDHFSLYLIKFAKPASSQSNWWVWIIVILLIVLVVLFAIGVIYRRTDRIDRIVEAAPLKYIYRRLIVEKNVKRQLMYANRPQQ